MRYSLLKVVQSVLSSMDSDEIESLNDGNTEADQIVLAAEDIFYELLGREEWPFIEKLISISSLNDVSNPTSLRLEENVRSIDKLRYDRKTNDIDYNDYQVIKYLSPNDFIDRSYNLRSTEDNVITVSPTVGDIPKLFLRNDSPPEFYTSFDDEIIVFDSYDSGVETTVQSSKALAHGEVIPTFQYEDDYIIELPEHVHPLYLAEVKAVCHVYFKQQQSPKDEQKVLRNISRLRRNKNRIGIDEYDLRARKDFGRHARPAGQGRKLGRR